MSQIKVISNAFCICILNTLLINAVFSKEQTIFTLILFESLIA